jgi:glutathione S-transferase
VSGVVPSPDEPAPAGTIRLWGRTSSINVRKVLWTLQAIGVPFERIDAGLSFGVVQTPAYRAHNPNALVPLLQDGDFTLWESNVIVRYLCAKYGAPTLATACASLPPEGAAPCLGRPGASAAAATLYPADLQQRFDAERWMDWQQTTLNRAGGPAFVQWIRTPAAERRRDLIAQSVAATEPLLRLLDAHLAQRRFMAGDALTMADIPIACEIHRWWGLPQPRPALAHLERWWDALRSHPASRGVLDQPLA